MKKILKYIAGIFSLLLISGTSFGQNFKTKEPVKHKDFTYKVIKKGDKVNTQSEKVTLHYIKGKVDVRRQEIIVITKDNISRKNMIRPKVEKREDLKK